MCAETPVASVTLPVDATAPARSRAFLVAAHCARHASSVLEDARLLVSELVTNAVRYGSPPITTQVECRGLAGMHVSVCDAAPGTPVVGEAAQEATGGRGTTVVDLLSSAWGVQPGQEGKAVWFELRPAPAEAGRGERDPGETMPG